MKKFIFSLFNEYMSVLAILTTILAYFANGSFTNWIGNPNFFNGLISINYLLMIVMFGMGLTTPFSEYIKILKNPKNIIIGEIAQFVIMPFTAFVLCFFFALPMEFTVGVILVGCCPGGTASNVITFLAKGDVALSIGMTSLSTVLAPFVTPLLTTFYIYLYQNTSNVNIEIDQLGMFLNIIQIVIIPVFLGTLINYFFNEYTKKIYSILPILSSISICLIIGFVIDANSAKLLSHGLDIIFVVILLNCLGFLLGFILAKIFKMQKKQRNAISIEVGMQNSGLATTLAANCFATLSLATVPGAIFSAWHNIAGAIFASIVKKDKNSEESK